jgi:hypothetical protein
MGEWSARNPVCPDTHCIKGRRSGRFRRNHQIGIKRKAVGIGSNGVGSLHRESVTITRGEGPTDEIRIEND